MILFLIASSLLVISMCFEESEYDKHKKNILPPFTKEEAERYYYTDLRHRRK
jgi:hypothetical protein